MRAMFGRDDMDSPRQEPPRQEQQSMGSSSRGSGSQYTNPSVGWHVRAGQGVPAFPGSRIVPTRRVDPRDASMQRMLKFGSTNVPKLSKANLVNTEDQAFDDSVMDSLSLLQRRQHPAIPSRLIGLLIGMWPRSLRP